MSYYRDLLASGLGRRGYEVRVVSKVGLLQATGGQLRRALLRRTPAILSTWPELWRQHLKDPDTWLVNISQEYVPPFAASRSINIIHDLTQIDFPRSRAVRWFYRSVLPRLARGAALNISVSKTTAARLGAMRIPSVVVYNEFEPPSAPDGYDRAPERPITACWVGTTSRHKNVGDYLEAARAMPDRAFVAVLPEGEALRLRRGRDLPSNLTLHHSLATERYTQLLGSCRYLVSTSLAEGFGRPPADGALAGCDIALTDIPIYRELYDGLARFYLPGDIPSLVAILSSEPRSIYEAARRRFRLWSEQHKLVDVIDGRIASAQKALRS